MSGSYKGVRLYKSRVGPFKYLGCEYNAFWGKVTQYRMGRVLRLAILIGICRGKRRAIGIGKVI
jgi:hypothetical protein